MDKKNIGALFDRIAGSYDGLNHFLSFGIDRRWRKKAVKGMSGASEVLDVAIGTGDLSMELLYQGKAEAITGLDLSRNMMEIGEAKLASGKCRDGGSMAGRVEFICGSALDMPFADERFDAVTCAYGVRNFSDLEKGLAEMYRVMKKEGELMVLEFSYPENRLVRWVYDLYFSHVLPFVGKVVSRDKTAYSYLNASVKGFIWGKEFCSRLEDAGFRDVSFRPMTFGVTTIYRAVK